MTSSQNAVGTNGKNPQVLPEVFVPQAPVVVPAGDHKLQYAYCLWFSHRSPGKKASVQDYDQNLKLIGHFASVEQFWALYSHIPRPSELQSPSDFHLFKAGIKPMWEDEANQKGGKWIVRLRKGLASRCWENLVLAMLGEQFMVGDEICGAVVSIRFQEDIISIWNKSASDTSTKGRIRDTLSRVLNLPPSTIVEYKTHSDSLKWILPNSGNSVRRMDDGINKDEDRISRNRNGAKHQQEDAYYSENED